MVSYDEAQLSTAGIVEAVEKTGYGAIPKDAPQRKAEAKAEISTAQAEYKAIKQQAKIPERHRPAGRLSAAQPLIRLPGQSHKGKIAQKQNCHSEPVRTLAWESPGSSEHFLMNSGDCHTSDIGHWFAMTAFLCILCFMRQRRAFYSVLIQTAILLSSVHSFPAEA